MNLLWIRYRILLIVFVFLGAILIGLTLFLGDVVDFGKPEQRIGFFQLIIEYFGLFALAIAILEFTRQLATPELELVAVFLNQSGKLQPSLNTIEYHEYQFLPDIGNGRFVFKASFYIVINNRGVVPAQFINISIDLVYENQVPAIWSHAATASLYLGQDKNWQAIEGQNWLPVFTKFTGDADFVLHTNDKPIPTIVENTSDWDNVAGFDVTCSGEGRNWQNAHIIVRCKVQSLNTRQQVKEFHLVIPETLVKG